MPQLVVIGGGAAGLMAAGTAAAYGIDVAVIEHMPRPARKVMITGKGRCNLTNNTDLKGLVSATVNGGRFMYSAFSAFSSEDTMALFERLGVPLKTERGNRVFPQSDKAVDIVDALKRYAEDANIINDKAVEIICDDGKVVAVKLESGRGIPADAVILATGGKSYPATGSDGSGYKLAEELGHSVTPLRPSLIPLVVHEGFPTALQGLTLKNVEIKVFEEEKKKPIYTDFGEMLFTHFGVSGPLILSASANMPKVGEIPYKIEIDLKPALDEQTLDSRILKDFAQFSNKNFGNSLDELLPKKLIPIMIKLCGIDPHKKVNAVTREERQRLVHNLKHLTVTAVGTRPIEEAVITSGGINLREVDPKTMASKLVSGLYFAGEILDVDAYTGGFNLQIAFSTGYLAGSSAAESLNVW